MTQYGIQHIAEHSTHQIIVLLSVILFFKKEAVAYCEGFSHIMISIHLMSFVSPFASFQKPFMHSFIQGAAISFGYDVEITGLETKVEITTLPITTIKNDRKIIVNLPMCRKQDLRGIDPRILLCLQSEDLITN